MGYYGLGSVFLPGARAALTVLLCWCAPLQAQSKAPDTPAPREDLVGRLKVASLHNEPVTALARKNSVSIPSVLAANWGLDEILVQSREDIVLPTAHILPKGLRDGILINRAEFRLYYLKDGALIASVPIGIGIPGKETPLGKTFIVRKQKNPIWRPTPEARREHPDWPIELESGPFNPLGAYALYLGWPAYLIHGSNNDFGIGWPFTRGCIRLYADDMENLYTVVPVDTRVEVVDQPVKFGWHADELFVEAHPDLSQLHELRERQAFTMKKAEDMSAIITKFAGARAADVDWAIVTAALERRSGIPTQITSLTSHPIDLGEPKIAMQGIIERAMRKTQNGFASGTVAKRTPEQQRAVEEMLKEQLRKDPYNI